MASTFIGLDLGSHTIKAVSVEQSGGSRFKISHAYVLDMPPEIVVDGEITNYADLSAQVGKLIESGGFPNMPIAVALKGVNTIAKRAKVPYVERSNFNEDIRFFAEQYVHAENYEYAIDYKVVKLDAASNEADVVFGAARKDLVSDYLSVLESAKLQARLVDLEVLALCDLYSALNLPKDSSSLILDIGHNLLKMIFVREGNFSYYITSGGGGGYCSSLLENLANVPPEEVENVKIEPDATSNKDTVISVINQNYLPDMIRSLDESFYKYSLLGGEKPERVYLSGGGASIYGLREGLEEGLGINVTLLNPEKEMEIVSPIAKQILENKPTILNVAIAMAIRT